MKNLWRLFMPFCLGLFMVNTTMVNAQVSNTIADQAYAGFNNSFIRKSGGLTFYKTSLNNTEKDYFWQQALDIQSAQDNYFRTKNEANKTLIVDLLNAFLEQNKDNNTNNVQSWEWNGFNDDLFWATIAFCRGYEYTGNPVFLAQAEYGFNLAYYHDGTGEWGWDDQLGGGIWWSKSMEHKETLSNGPGIVSACYLYQFTKNQDYLDKAIEIYSWLRTTLFNPNTGEVYSKIAANGDVNYSVNVFNSGSFGGAANCLYQITGDLDYFNDAKLAFDYIKNTKFDNGILYATSRGGSENAEYIRWLAEFVRQNHLWDEYYPWMKLNADVAWNMRRTDLNITWNDWRTQSPMDNSTANESNSGVVIQEVTPIVQDIPAKIEAENYNFMKGAVTEATSDTDGGLNVHSLISGDYLEYVIKVPSSGLYVINYSIASTVAGSVSLSHSGQPLSTTVIPNTGGAQAWQDVSTTVNLVKGIQSIRLVASVGGWSINSLDITKNTDCDSTPIIANQNVNNAGWVQESSSVLAIGESIALAPEAELLDGSWSWIGPNGFTANSREITITDIQLNQGGTYRATYTNECSANSTQDFIVTVKPPCVPLEITPYLNANNGGWKNVSSVSVASGSSINFGPQAADSGTWNWSGPNGFTSTARDLTLTSINESMAGIYSASYTTLSGCISFMDFRITVDSDGDGIPDENDNCSNTEVGATVDIYGCAVFTLPTNNFTIETIGETCPNEKNGKIIITPKEQHNYQLKVNGVDSIFSDGITLGSLAPDTYNLCLSVEGEEFTQCFEIVIHEATRVSGKSSVNNNKATVQIEKGRAPYKVFINGKVLFETMSSSIDVNVKHGDLLEIKTAVACEGVISKKIELLESIVAYPNPSKGDFEIGLPIAEGQVNIEVYNTLGQLVEANNYQIMYGKVRVNLSKQPKGLYIAKVYLEQPITLKLIKE
jgi:hypothetical protein